MSANLTVEEKQTRVMAVIYSMSKGIVGVQIKKTDLLNEINRLGVMQMSDEEFEAYRTNAVKNFRRRSVN